MLGTLGLMGWFVEIIVLGALSIPVIIFAAFLLIASIMLREIFESFLSAAINAKKLGE
jgi:hypothetical protein